MPLGGSPIAAINLLKQASSKAVAQPFLAPLYGFIRRDGLPAVTLGGRGNLRVIKSSLLRWITEREEEHRLD